MMLPIIAANTIQMGEICSNQISRTTASGIIAVFQVIPAVLDILKSEDAISATTTGRMPLKIAATTSFSRNPLKYTAMIRIIKNAGSTAPSVVTRLPRNPLTL